MFCPNCGSEQTEGSTFCGSCGAKLNAEQPKAQTPPVDRTAQPVVIRQQVFTEDSLPERYRPLGAWAYFGYTILFSIPIVGLILLIVFSLSDANINRRNFARSFWCTLVLALIIFLVLLVVALVTVGSLSGFFRNLFR